jgi:hypothetical protein
LPMCDGTRFAWRGLGRVGRSAAWADAGWVVVAGMEKIRVTRGL